MRLPKKCLVDTNVPKTANRHLEPENIPEELEECVLACIEAIEYLMDKCHLVMDAGDEIFEEYRRQLSIEGQPGLGDRFMKWLHDNRWKWPEVDRVSITQKGDSYEQFPDHEGLAEFDRSDRKFVAAANAHPGNPPILQATDSKWWGWREALADVDIPVRFLCPEYIKTKYEEKMGS